MKKLLVLLMCVISLVCAGDLRSTPCQYLMPGEVLQSGGDSNGRYCIVNLSNKKEDNTSYLIHMVYIWYPTNTLSRINWVVMPFCSMSQIGIFQNGNRTMYMVDTLSEDSWMKLLYRRTCD